MKPLKKLWVFMFLVGTQLPMAQWTGNDSLHLLLSFKDVGGNRIQAPAVASVWYVPAAYDIVIHEIMYDPEPVAGLPPVEYVELYNRSGFPVGMNGWKFEYGTQRKIFPSVTIPPGGYLLLTKDSTLQPYGNVLPIFSSGFSLSNEGSCLVLRNAGNQIIHSVHYLPDWFENSWKGEGGWALEMVDPANPCGCSENWEPSTDISGGTPGRSNSVMRNNPDLIPPEVLRSHFYREDTWEIRFSEQIDTTTMGMPEHWILEPGEANPVTISSVEPALNALRLTFPEPFQSGITYTLTGIVPVTDCAGNPVTGVLTTQAAIPETIGRDDVLINEVLSDPYPGSSRFIELVNNSGKVISLHELALISADVDTPVSLTDGRLLTAEPYLVFPLGFVAVCAHERGVKDFYRTPNPNHFLEMKSFPPMKNESGQIWLIRWWDGEVIDRMTYREEMHYPLLTSTEGVSLERISLSMPSTEPANWHSAAAFTGYATPAYENSQRFQEGQTMEIVTVKPPVFSPDNDGRDDVVSIGYLLDASGFQASVTIFDSRGRVVRKLVSNSLIGLTGEFFWDGFTDERRRVDTGIYLIYLEFIHPSGIVKKIRKPVVVTSRF